jgi:hypothetical protein
VVFEVEGNPSIVSSWNEYPRVPLIVAHYMLGTGRGFASVVDTVLENGCR